MNKQIWTFITLSYLFTWTSSFTIYFLFKKGILNEDQLNLFHSIGALGPTLAALITAVFYYNKDGVIRLLSKLKLKKETKPTWLLALSPLAFFILGLLLYPVFTGHWFSFETTKEAYHLSSTNSYVGWLLPMITYGIFEELGWRGFLLLHLQEKYTAFQATIILTFIWALWHAPFFLFRLDFSLFISIGFLFGMFVGAIILTSIYNFSRGGLLGVILFHFTNNIASEFEKEYIVAILSTGFVFLAISIYKKYKPANLANRERVKNYFIVRN